LVASRVSAGSGFHPEESLHTAFSAFEILSKGAIAQVSENFTGVVMTYLFSTQNNHL
jgi:hypothetical protein